MSALSVAFRGQLGAFQLDTAFEAPLDGVTALFGPSGSGKTTILRAMAGLERLDGRCALGPLVWQDRSHFVPTHRRGIGYVFQEASLFQHLSVRANLLYGYRRVRGEKAITFEAVVELLKLWKLLDRAPERLSGGERQRVSLGRALLSQPRLLLLDEPMSALDRGAREEILPYFETLHKAMGLPMVLVSHDIGEVERLASHLILIGNGRVTAEGPLNAMLTSSALPLHRHRDAASVLSAEIVSFDGEDELTELTLAGQRLLVSGRAGETGDIVRVRVMARDVSLSVEHSSRTTILNILPVVIDAIEPGLGPDATVTLALGGQKLLARVTRRSVAALNLAAGQQVYAQIKGVSLLTAPQA